MQKVFFSDNSQTLPVKGLVTLQLSLQDQRDRDAGKTAISFKKISVMQHGGKTAISFKKISVVQHGGKTAISFKKISVVQRRSRCTTPKSSKTGECGAFARLAAFSFQK